MNIHISIYIYGMHISWSMVISLDFEFPVHRRQWKWPRKLFAVLGNLVSWCDLGTYWNPRVGDVTGKFGGGIGLVGCYVILISYWKLYGCFFCQDLWMSNMWYWSVVSSWSVWSAGSVIRVFDGQPKHSSQCLRPHIETNTSWILLYDVWTAAWQPWQTCSDKANDSGDRQSQITALQVGWWKVNSTFHPVTNGLMPFESCQLE